MKVLILGSEGYIGKFLAKILEKNDYEVLRANRSIIDFDDPDSNIKFTELLDQVNPRIIINTIGAIDGVAQQDFRLLFNSILLPSFLLLDYYQKNKMKYEVTIYLLGSTAAGEPRVGYPYYASLKYAEIGLSRSAFEIFMNSKVDWRLMIVPRLKGGLANMKNAIKDGHIIKDVKLEEVADNILRHLDSIVRDKAK
jgi:RmlD substrate binding domain